MKIWDFKGIERNEYSLLFIPLLTNKGMSFPFSLLKLSNKKRKKYSKIIFSFHSIPSLENLFHNWGLLYNNYRRRPHGPTPINKEFSVQPIFVLLFAMWTKPICKRKNPTKGIIRRCGLEGKPVILYRYGLTKQSPIGLRQLTRLMNHARCNVQHTFTCSRTKYYWIYSVHTTHIFLPVKENQSSNNKSLTNPLSYKTLHFN